MPKNKIYSGEKVNSFFLYHVVRERLSENQVWVTHIAMLVDENAQQWREISKNPDKALGILRDRIRSWLTTQAGWNENCRACLDFNWGDATMALPLSDVGLYKSPDDLPGPYRVVGNCDVLVNQDELLAPDNVPCMLELTDQNGTVFTKNGNIDFQVGSAIISDELDEIDDVVAAIAILENGARLKCSVDKNSEIFLLERKWN